MSRLGIHGSAATQALLFIALAASLAAGAYRTWLAPLGVSRYPVTRGELVAEVMGTGTLEARLEATISTRIPGRLLEVAADQGDRVKAGQGLARLDDSELTRQVQVEEAALGAVAAGLDRLLSERQRAEAIQSRAAADLRRGRELLSKRAIAQAEFEKYQESSRVAQADVARAAAAVVEGRRQMEAARRRLEYQRAVLADTTLRAPFDGLVVRRDRDPGEVVVPGTSVLALVSTERMWVRAWLDETNLPALRPGQPARVVFRSEPASSYPGRVDRIGREADRETRELLVDVTVLELPPAWAVGQRAEVYIESARKNAALLLPAALVSPRAGQPGVFVEQAGRARWRPLEFGLRHGETLEVASGLAPGDVVVSAATTAGAALSEGRRLAAP